MFKYRAVNNLAVTQDLEVDDDLDVKRTITCATLQASTIVTGSLTQAAKLALVAPAIGTTVFDTTAGAMSFYNGFNWYLPSWISFKASGTTVQGDIVWTSSSASSDTRITRSGAVFTLTDTGTYQVCSTATFIGKYSIVTPEPERSCQFLFYRSPATLLASSTGQIQILDSADSNGTASISYNLSHTAGSTYYFSYSSLSQGSASLSSETHGFIARVQ